MAKLYGGETIAFDIHAPNRLLNIKFRSKLCISRAEEEFE
jgi:hypothetical protein